MADQTHTASTCTSAPTHQGLAPRTFGKRTPCSHQATTLIVDESTSSFELHGAYALFDNFWEFFSYATGTDEEPISLRYRLLMAATEGGRFGRQGLTIDVLSNDGTASSELRALVEIALERSGAMAPADDLKLKIGAYSLYSEYGPFMELFVGGGAIANIVLITGPLASELLTTIEGFDVRTAPTLADTFLSQRAFMAISGRLINQTSDVLDAFDDETPLAAITHSLGSTPTVAVAA